MAVTPAAVLRQIGVWFFSGMLLGPWADLLRPLKGRFSALIQLGIGLGFFAVWIICGFGVSGADLRIGYYLAMLAGFALWERLFGSACCAFTRQIWQFADKPRKFLQNFFVKS